MDIVTPRTAPKTATTPPPQAPRNIDAEKVDVYVWKPKGPMIAKTPKAPPPHDHEPATPIVSLSSSSPSWPRVWRIFLAGAIMGLAITKATELLLKRDKPAKTD